MNKEMFYKEVEKLGIILTENQKKQLEEYYNFLIEYNHKTNLTRITKKEEVYLKHFYDSLTIFKIINLKQELTVIDIGTGAGFPGLVLKIVFPNLKVTLLDSLGKRIDFLNIVIKKLKLKNIETIHARIEDYKDKKFDIVTSRAVARINLLLEMAIDLVKENGCFILLKSDVEKELKEAEKAFKILHLKLDQKEEFLLPLEKSKRTVLKIKKIGNHSKEYPRNFAKIKKSPL